MLYRVDAPERSQWLQAWDGEITMATGPYAGLLGQSVGQLFAQAKADNYQVIAFSEYAHDNGPGQVVSARQPPLTKRQRYYRGVTKERNLARRRLEESCI